MHCVILIDDNQSILFLKVICDNSVHIDINTCSHAFRNDSYTIAFSLLCKIVHIASLQDSYLSFLRTSSCESTLSYWMALWLPCSCNGLLQLCCLLQMLYFDLFNSCIKTTFKMYILSTFVMSS